MKALARSVTGGGTRRVYIVGGGTAVLLGWRPSTIDADLHADDDAVFKDIQTIKEALAINIEFVRPEDSVPRLSGSEDRHVFIQSIGAVRFFHYDPYAQLLSKVVRGFARDMQDARRFISSGMVDPECFRRLVLAIPAADYVKYPSISTAAVVEAVEKFLEDVGP
jgi:hypothetical protein